MKRFLTFTLLAALAGCGALSDPPRAAVSAEPPKALLEAIGKVESAGAEQAKQSTAALTDLKSTVSTADQVSSLQECVRSLTEQEASNQQRLEAAFDKLGAAIAQAVTPKEPEPTLADPPRAATAAAAGEDWQSAVVVIDGNGYDVGSFLEIYNADKSYEKWSHGRDALLIHLTELGAQRDSLQPIADDILDHLHAALHGYRSKQQGRSSSGGTEKVLSFTSTWCGPCRELEPTVKAASDSGVDVVFVNTDSTDAETRRLVAKFKIDGLPTLVRVDSSEREIFRVPVDGADKFSQYALERLLYGDAGPPKSATAPRSAQTPNTKAQPRSAAPETKSRKDTRREKKGKKVADVETSPLPTVPVSFKVEPARPGVLSDLMNFSTRAIAASCGGKIVEEGQAREGLVPDITIPRAKKLLPLIQQWARDNGAIVIGGEDVKVIIEVVGQPVAMDDGLHVRWRLSLNADVVADRADVAPWPPDGIARSLCSGAWTKFPGGWAEAQIDPACLLPDIALEGDVVTVAWKTPPVARYPGNGPLGLGIIRRVSTTRLLALRLAMADSRGELVTDGRIKNLLVPAVVLGD